MNNAPTRPVLYELELALASSRTSDRGGPAAVVVEQLLAGFFFYPRQKEPGQACRAAFCGRCMCMHANRARPLDSTVDTRHFVLGHDCGSCHQTRRCGRPGPRGPRTPRILCARRPPAHHAPFTTRTCFLPDPSILSVPLLIIVERITRITVFLLNLEIYSNDRSICRRNASYTRHAC